jgi:hypothetical protein
MDIRGRLDFLIGKTLVHIIGFFKKLFPHDPQLLGSKMAKQGCLSKETVLAQINETLEFLKELGIEVADEPRVEKMKRMFGDGSDYFYVTVDLPFSKTSDYSFRLYFHDFGQREICANLLDKETGKPLDVYFWGHCLEVWDHGYYSFEELTADYHKTLQLVVENETRVILQDMGRLWHLSCEALVDGEWTSVPGGSSVFKEDDFKLPEVDGLVKQYHSKPLALKRK